MISQDDYGMNKSQESTSFIGQQKNQQLVPLNPSAAPKLMPMSPLAASVTVVNLVLATGPFR